MKNKTTQFYLKQLEVLVGGKVIGLVHDEAEEFYGVRIQKKDGTIVAMWILQDDEGNGPGSFEIS